MEGPLVGIFGIRGIHFIAEALMLVLIVNNKSNRIFKFAFSSPPVVIWSMWIIYVLVNWYFFQDITPSDNNNPSSINFITRKLVIPLFCMGIAYYECLMNPTRFIRFSIWILIVYLIVGMLFQTAATADDRGGEALGNNLPLTACVLASLVYWAYIKRIVNGKGLVLVSILILMAIFFGATRKALGAWVIVTFFYVIGKYNIEDPKKLFALIVIGFAFYYSIEYVLQYTLMGQRMNVIEDSASQYNLYDNVFLKYMGDRAYFYVSGWELFLMKPVNGIGLNNFPVYMNNGKELVIHSEYMTQLCEGGIIGSSLYVIFVSLILYFIFKSKRYATNRMEKLICIGSMASMLFISFYAWTYSLSRYFVLYGIILAICRPFSCGFKLKNKK